MSIYPFSISAGQRSAQVTTSAPRRSYAQAAHNPAQQDSHVNQPAQGNPQATVDNTPSYSQAAQGQQNNNRPPQGSAQPPSYSQAAQGQQNRPAESSPQPSGGNAPAYSQAAQNRPPSTGPQGGSRPANVHPTPYPSSNRVYVRPTVATRTPINNVTDDDLRAFSDDLLRADTNNAGSTVRANFQARTYGSNVADLAPAP